MFLLLVATYTISLTSTVVYSVQTSIVDFSSVSTPGDITVADFSTVTQMKPVLHSIQTYAVDNSSISIPPDNLTTAAQMKPVSSVTVCDGDLKSIECVNKSKIFIQSVSYGRSDDVTCLGFGQAVPACNASIDLSWLVLPDCQGKSSCNFNGSYDLQDAPCDGNKTNYFNITYVCKELDEVEIAEGSVQNFKCLPGEVIVIHYAEWRGVEVITKIKTISQNSSPDTSKYSVPLDENMTPQSTPTTSVRSTDSSYSKKTTPQLEIISTTFQLLSIQTKVTSFSTLMISPQNGHLHPSSSSSSSSSAAASAPLLPHISLSPSVSWSSRTSWTLVPKNTASLSSTNGSLVLSFNEKLTSSVMLLTNSSTFKTQLPNKSLMQYEYYNITEVLEPKEVFKFKFYTCNGKPSCSLDVSRKNLGYPYGSSSTVLRLFVRHSCQPALGGYLQWTSWSACPEICDINYHQVRRRICKNPTLKTGGSDCHGRSSETKATPCYFACTVYNITFCESMMVNISCPNGSFINVYKTLYGRDQGSYNVCDSNGPNGGSCLSSTDLADHNNAQVYERCQMRSNCTFMVSNETFKDPCPGVAKILQIQYTCSLVFELNFCDGDLARISCPSDKQLVFHRKPFYGRLESSTEFCASSSNNQTCDSGIGYSRINRFCQTSSCKITNVLSKDFGCKTGDNYLTVYQSCQGVKSIYTAWTPWTPCEACGLTARRTRWRDCVAPGTVYFTPAACESSDKVQVEPCYIPCAEHKLTLNGQENSTIVCLNYTIYDTVIEIRSVFYGSDNCPSNSNSTLNVTKRCQGRKKCHLEASAAMFNDSCPGNMKFLNVTYRCQSIYHLTSKEHASLVPRNLTCFDNMVIVTHSVFWGKYDCHSPLNALQSMQRVCDGKNNCDVVHSRNSLGNPCPSVSHLDFETYYSCQTAFGGLATEWSSWSNCTECGHTPLKRRIKSCLSPVNQSRGAHCPLMMQMLPCNFFCPVDGLAFLSDTFSVALGEALSVKWRLKLGTNSTAIMRWGDRCNETLAYHIMANATNPFYLTNEHNYSFEGDYEVTLYAFNSFSNQTVSRIAYVRVELFGLSITVRSILRTNESFYLNASLAVVSQLSLNVTFRFGDGSVLRSQRLLGHYHYPKAGVFVAEVEVENKVSKIKSSRRITVEDAIKVFSLEKDVYKVALGNNVSFAFSVAQGSNVTVTASFVNCGARFPFLTAWLNGPKLNSSLKSSFLSVGVCNVVLNASNAISRANTSALIISEIAISGLNVTIECQSRYPSCFQHDQIILKISVMNGTVPKFVLDMGDGVIISSMNNLTSHSFAQNDTFHVNITAYNNVSSRSVFRKVRVIELVPVTAIYLHCNETVGLREMTVCNLGVKSGTAFQCWLHMGDREQAREVFYTYVNLTSSFSYNYTWYGIYVAKLSCNNTISSTFVEFTTKKVPDNLRVSVTHNGPVMMDRILTLNLSANDIGYPSYFVLHLGNGDSVIFGWLNSTSGLQENFKQFTSFPYPYVLYNYTYSVPAIYHITWNGMNDLNNASVDTFVSITDRPCSPPKVSLRNIADNPLTPTRIVRSRGEFIIRSRYQVNCESVTGVILRWDILKKDLEKGFKLQSSKVTKSSELILQLKELEHGIYRVKLTLSLVSAYGISGTAEGYMTIMPSDSDLKVDFQEGSAMKRMLQYPILLNAVGSRDHDSPDQSGLEFNWHCYNASGTSFSEANEPLSSLQDTILSNPLINGCFGQNISLPMKGSQIALPEENMMKGGIYLVKLLLNSGDRNASKAAVIQITDEEISYFSIRCRVNCEQVVVTTSILSVSGHCIYGVCQKTPSTLFSWEVFFRSANATETLNWTKATLNDLEKMTSSNITFKNLVFKANFLKPETSYVIRLRQESDNYKGLTEYSFKTSRPPHNGNCSVEPTEGTAFKTIFTFRCLNWKTKHVPLFFIISYFDPYTHLKTTLAQGEENEFTAKLPAGDPTNNLLEIHFRVTDALGARIYNHTAVKVFPRDFDKSNLSGLVLSEQSTLDFYINIGDIDSVFELVSGVTSNLNRLAELSGGNFSDQIGELHSEVRFSVIEKISRISISSLTGVNQMASLIAATGEVKEQLNSSAQITATNTLEAMVIFLLNKSQEDVDLSMVTEGATNLVAAVFNILMSASFSANFTRENLVSEEDRNKSKNVVNRNMGAFDQVAEAIFNKKLSGQEDIEIQTKSATLTCRRDIGHRVQASPIVAGNASVQFPDIKNLFSSEEVDAQLLHLSNNPFSWDESSKLVTTSILDVKVCHSHGERLPINISNLPEDIDIQIPFTTVPSLEALNSFSKQNDNESIQYHTFEVEDIGQAIEFFVKPLENQEQIMVLIKYGEKPTILEHDIKVKLPNFSSCVTTGKSSFDDSNCTENPYSIFLPSTYLKQFGTYYVGVKYDIADEVPFPQSRRKRECGEGKRSKRSCIKYKDPPPTENLSGKFVKNQQKYDRSTHSNYTIKQTRISCNFWNPSSNQFSSGGCRPGRRRSSSQSLPCRCKHLTSFGGSLLVKPNPIDLNNIWVAFADIHNNIAVLATMITVLLLYLVVIVWARKADLQDQEIQKDAVLIGRSCNPFSYEITISTSKRRNSGTTANVALVIVGENGSSGVIQLSKLTSLKFKRGSVVRCTILLQRWLGQLVYLRIWHDNLGDSPAWSLDHVTILDRRTSEELKFICNEWLAVESDLGRTDKVMYAAGIDEMTNYKNLFLSNSSDGLYDGHLWISVAVKPPQSTFTRIQRASCCLSLLFCAMITNAMFYDDGSLDNSSVFVLGPFKLSLRHLVVGIQSGLIIFPFNFILTHVFRKVSTSTSAKKETLKGPFQKAGSNASTHQFIFRNSTLKCTNKIRPSSHGTHLQTTIRPPDILKTPVSEDAHTSTTTNFFDPGWKSHNRKLKRKENKYFYCFLFCTAWVLCFVSVGASGFFTLLYSLQWGKEKSEQWLLSFFFSFVQDAAICQPVKVFMFSAAIAFIMKFSLDLKEKHKPFSSRNSGIDDVKKERFPKEMFDDNTCVEEFQPLSKKALKKAKLRRMKEIKSSQVIKEVLLYLLFLFLLLVVAYSHRDSAAYEMTVNLENHFSISVRTYLDVLVVTLRSFIPSIFEANWYNDKAPSLSEDGLIIDGSSVLVGMARIRQHRIKSDSCSYVNPVIRHLSNGCFGFYTITEEDTHLYQPNWVPVLPSIPSENISYELCPRPWRYYSASDLNGVPMLGKTALYSGGGYVAELGYHTSKAQEVIEELTFHNWIDRRSRGIFIELTVYNAQVNLFGVITILAEVMPTGGVEMFHRIDIIRVYRYLGQLGYAVLISELTICLVILFFVYKVIKRVYYQKVAYLRTFWNLVDFCQVLFALASIALYFVKVVNITETMKDLKKNPFVFVSFSLLLTWNEIDTYMIAFVVFLTTIKFLHLLRYNNHIRFLSYTFFRMRKDILLFMVEFNLWFIPFALMFHLSFGRHLQDFMSLTATIQTMLSALLGGPYFRHLQEVDRVLAPVLYIFYSLLMVLILLNMFVSIINFALADRKCLMKDAETDPELVAYLIKKLTRVLGVNALVHPGDDHKMSADDDSSDEELESRRDCLRKRSNSIFKELKTKISSMQEKLRNVSMMEKDEELFLETILMTKRNGSTPP